MGESVDGRQARLTQRFGDGDDRPEAETAGADEPAGPAATSTTTTAGSSGTAGENQEDTDEQSKDGWEIPTGAGGTGEITDHGADDLESWISQRKDRGELYGILHIQLRVFRNLSGTNRALQSQKRVDHPGEGSGQPPMMFGGGTLIQTRKLRSLATAARSVATNSTSQRASALDLSRKYPTHSRQR